MGLTINTNIASLQSQMSLNNSSQALQNNQQRLATGLRINSAADDAAGLTITDGMTSQIRGMNQAVRNANDGISMAQTAEGGVGEITEMLQRMRDLAVQAANETNTDDDLKALHQEFSELQDEISRVAEATKFNEKSLLIGTAANSHSGTIKIQVGPNTTSSDSITLNLDTDMTASAIGTSGTEVGGLDIGSGATATAMTNAITSIDEAISTADSFRSELGATINRLESSISNLENASQNLTESRSRIMDADIAKESAEMTQNNVRQQASAAVLAQANQQPQIALQLLG